MLLELVTPPDATPVSTAEAKTHLAVEHTEHDTFITSLIDAVTAELDGRFGYLRRALVTQTWRYSLPFFPACRKIELPLPPLQSVTSVKYYDGNGDEQTLSTDSYRVVSNAFVGYIELVPAQSWPGTAYRSDAVTIEYVAGFGDAADVPANIKAAMLLRIGELYAGRGDGDAPEGMGKAAARLLAPSRIVTVP